MSTPTTNYSFQKPDFNIKPWDQTVNANYDLLDTILYTITQIPNIGGVWKNSTQYMAGQNVLDQQSLVFYQCVTTNVSAATGTFAADRTANPTYWTVTNAGQGSIRYDQGQVLTVGQIQQALTNLTTLSTAQMQAVFLRFDAGQTLTYNQQLQVLNNLLIDGTESILTAAATTDVGNAGSQNVRIDGTTTIVSFGARPNKYKLIRFTNSLTLTNSASLILPGGQNIQTLAGDTCVATSDSSNNWYIRAYQRADSSLVAPSSFGQCRLVYTDSATLTLQPYNGNLLWINGAYRKIPAGGLTVTNAGLAANTGYYIYAYWTGTAIALEFSTTARAADATWGHQIKSGDPTRTLVGGASTGAGTPGIFADTSSNRRIASWYNRIARSLYVTTTGNVATGSTTAVVLGPLSYFFCWLDDPIFMQLSGYARNNTAGAYPATQFMVDGVTIGQISLGNSVTADSNVPVASTMTAQLTEGFHTVGVGCSVNSGVGYWTAAGEGFVRS